MNVLIFQSRITERETYIEAMRLTLTDQRGPTLDMVEAIEILRSAGWSNSEIAEYGNAAVLACEQFQCKWVDKLPIKT